MEETSVAKNVEMRVQLMFPDIHTKEFQCPICAKYFSRKFTLDAHMLIHKGEKPHACPFCGKCFRQKGTLMRHKALHSTKNLFHCNLCNRGFRQKNVFIHHLRHRHNVSVETLDRRKYRTELKDYQSIMDTLPSFVHADSTAIASSEKHFDAVLFESIKKPGSDSAEVLTDDCLTANSQQNDQTSVILNKPPNSENVSQMKNFNLYVKDCDSLYLKVNSNGSDCKQNCEEMNINRAYPEGRKTVIKNDFAEVNTTVSFATLPQVCSSSTLDTDYRNLTSSQSGIITSSNDINDESLICIPCQLSFSNEVEFKCHVKTHVQSVLLGDVHSENQSLTHLQKSFDAGQCTQFKNDSASLDNISVPMSPISFKSFSSHVDIPDCNIHNEINVPVKQEIMDSEVETSISPNDNEIELSVTSLPRSNFSGSNLKCPVCKIVLQDENTFRNHSKEHDSFSLLKVICELLTNPSIDENKVSNLNVVSSEKTFLNRHIVNSYKNLKESALKVDFQFKKSVTKRKCSKKMKYVFKKLSCVQCNEKFSSKLLFEYHRQLHLNTKGFFCKCCKKSFVTKKLLLSHTRLYHMKTFTCSKCSRIFNYQRFFQSHQKMCRNYAEIKTTNGCNVNFPILSIESLLKSDMDGIVGIIPVCSNSLSGGVQVGIPVMSVSQIKTLHAQSSPD